MHIYCTT